MLRLHSIQQNQKSRRVAISQQPRRHSTHLVRCVLCSTCDCGHQMMRALDCNERSPPSWECPLWIVNKRVRQNLDCFLGRLVSWLGSLSKASGENFKCKSSWRKIGRTDVPTNWSTLWRKPRMRRLLASICLFGNLLFLMMNFAVSPFTRTRFILLLTEPETNLQQRYNGALRNKSPKKKTAVTKALEPALVAVPE